MTINGLSWFQNKDDDDSDNNNNNSYFPSDKTHGQKEQMGHWILSEVENLAS